ncbi:PepSY domain-containing protein [Niveispirillum sp.]|uniref:PepSY domain-containing protein n=1 Tax=Niveispirillum sp. TaxID=1917217 RepID=UPI001B52406C|nr:PepSY domain-containing protein [Niveispirillum sp.]MBP7338974.1 PepSY domain-containing protein [Niveispirillum sp.]
MRPASVARKTHKWLALLIGIQALIWAISGLYMVAVPLEIIHGDHFAHPHGAPSPLALDKVQVNINQVRQAYGDVRAVRLKMVLDEPYYVVEHRGGVTLVNAVTGAERAPLSDAEAARLARTLYTGKAEVSAVSLLTDVPSEIRGRAVPVWQVRFEGWNDHTLYISPVTGDLLARRHNLWRTFDFVWMFHIMDYVEREDVNNPLVRVATVAASIVMLSGVWLLFYSFRRRRAAAAR